MKFLLDTHVFLWFLEGNERLTPRWRAFISDASHQFLISHVVPWEISIKVALGKLSLDRSPAALFSDHSSVNGFEFLPIRLPHVIRQAELPFHHSDPFDRLLVAQCEVEKIRLISFDQQLKPYGVVVKRPE